MNESVLPSGESDDQVVRAALEGDQEARRELYRRFGPRLRRLAHRRAPELARQNLIGDVMQETWLGLFRRGPDQYDPNRGSVFSFLSGLLLNAVKTVRRFADGAPGRTRRRKPPSDTSKPMLLSLESEMTAIDGKPSKSIYMVIESNWQDERNARDDAIDFELVLGSAPSTVALALWLTSRGGWTLSNVARELGMTRFTLQRRINRFIESFRHQAA